MKAIVIDGYGPSDEVLHFREIDEPVVAADEALVLTPNGIYLASFGQSHNTWLGPVAKLLRMMVLSRFVSQKMALLAQHRKKEESTRSATSSRTARSRRSSIGPTRWPTQSTRSTISKPAMPAARSSSVSDRMMWEET